MGCLPPREHGGLLSASGPGTIQVPVKRLDVEKWRSIQRIEAADDKPGPLHPHKVHEADGDGVRPFRRTGRKDPVLALLLFVRGDGGEDIAAGTVAPVEDEEVGMVGEISQPLGVTGKDLYLARLR